MNYLLHVGLLLAACFVYYRFLLRTETRFQLNRWLLIGCVVVSFGLPLIQVPAAWSLRSFTEEAIVTNFRPAPSTAEETMLTESTQVTEFTEPHGRESSTVTSTLAPAAASIDWKQVFTWIYLAGLLVFGLQFMLQIGALLLRMLRHPGHDLGDYRLVELDQPMAPYSFWNRIFLNPSQYDPDTFHQIVEHERIHVAQKHSIDILLAELLIVVQWWNPFAWFYRSAIEHNLEYLTDSEMIRLGTDPVSYQLSLVRVAIPNHPEGLSSNYNQTFLEKRIAMMKTKKSSNRTAWKYLALLPLLLFSVLQLNAVDQSAVVNAPEPAVVEQPTVVEADPPLPQVDVAEITREAAASAVANIPATPVDAAAAKSWTAVIKGEQVCFHFIMKGDRFHSTHEECITKQELGTLPGNSMGKFSLTRYAGTMNFNGAFNDGEGIGTFNFTPDARFTDLLKKEGYGTYKEEELVHFFYADFTPGYLTYLSSLGYTPDRQKLLEVALFFDNQQEMRSRLAGLKKHGFEQPGLQKLIELQIHRVSDRYIEELAKVGYPDLGLNQLLEAKIHGLDAEFLSDMKQAGFTDLSFNEAKNLAIHHVTSDYVAELKGLGYTALSAREVTEAKIHGVSADQIAGLQKAGLIDLTLQEAKELAIHRVDQSYANQLAQLGYDQLTASELVAAKIHGVSTDQVADLKAAGYDNLSLDRVRSLAIHGVTSSYIKSLQETGLGSLELDEIQAAKIHGVTADFIRKNRDRGEDLGDFINLKIRGR